MRRRFFVIVGLVLAFGVALWASDSDADVPVSIDPHKIVLNAQLKGQLQDIQAIISMPLESGCGIQDFEVSLLFDDIRIVDAHSFRYCYVDQNFLASFDRRIIQEDPYVLGLGDAVVEATVRGWYTAVDSGGNTLRVEFTGSDDVEILNPGMPSSAIAKIAKTTGVQPRTWGQVKSLVK